MGSTSSAAAERNKSTDGSREASASDSSRKWPEPVMHHAMRERGGEAASGGSPSSAARAAPRGSILLPVAGGSPFVVMSIEPAGSIGWRDFDVKLVEFSVQGVAADIERLGDVAHVPTMLLEHLQQHL